MPWGRPPGESMLVWQPWQLLCSWCAGIQLPGALPPAELRVCAAQWPSLAPPPCSSTSMLLCMTQVGQDDISQALLGRPIAPPPWPCMVPLEPCAQLIDCSVPHS